MRNLARRLTWAVCRIDEAYLLGTQQGTDSENEYYFMYAVDDGASHTQAEICREWMIPKTTFNTIVKRWEREGRLTLTPVPGQRREREISLTDSGRAYVQKQLACFYQAEEAAMRKTLEQYDPSFIEALVSYGVSLRDALQSPEQT